MSGPQHFTFADAPFHDAVAHGGRGEVAAARVLGRDARAGLAFVDLVVVPPGCGIGTHTHGDDEEIYVVVDGEATMVVDGSSRALGAGHVVVNRAGGTHALHNTGPTPLRLVVVDVAAGPSAP